MRVRLDAEERRAADCVSKSGEELHQKCDGIRLRVRQDTFDEFSGEAVERLSATVQKRIRDPKTGEYRTVDTYFDRDLPRLALVAHEAFKYITLRSEDSDEPPI